MEAAKNASKLFAYTSVDLKDELEEVGVLQITLQYIDSKNFQPCLFDYGSYFAGCSNLYGSRFWVNCLDDSEIRWNDLS